MNRNWHRTTGLLLALLLGGLVPALHVLSFLVRPALVVMLFLAFLDLSPAQMRPQWRHAVLLALPALVAFLVWILVSPWDRELALAGVLVALAPTATASPVVTSLLGGRPGFVVTMVLLSSLLQGALLPAALGWTGGLRFGLSPWPVLAHSLGTVAIPLVLSWGVRLLPRRIGAGLRRVRPASFWLWLLVLVLAMSAASDSLHRAPLDPRRLAAFGALSLGLCLVHFALGRKVGGTAYGLEAGQSLGQRNTLFAIWVGLTFASPLAALGPTLYVVWHNLANALQLQRAGRSGAGKGG